MEIKELFNTFCHKCPQHRFFNKNKEAAYCRKSLINWNVNYSQADDVPPFHVIYTQKHKRKYTKMTFEDGFRQPPDCDYHLEILLMENKC